jgi:hypothetical protein
MCRGDTRVKFVLSFQRLWQSHLLYARKPWRRLLIEYWRITRLPGLVNQKIVGKAQLGRPPCCDCGAVSHAAFAIYLTTCDQSHMQLILVLQFRCNLGHICSVEREIIRAQFLVARFAVQRLLLRATSAVCSFSIQCLFLHDALFRAVRRSFSCNSSPIRCSFSVQCFCRLS